MALDPRIKQAIVEAVEESGQSEALASRLSAWFEAVASGNEDINDKESAVRHLDVLYDATDPAAVEGHNKGED